ncbi:MAG: ribulose-phosphate 3-epimerase [Bacteroidetes bacterium]|nr:ribulose-phosphate 3-epimerase [Bacteroidota bacterium]MCH8523337.1 ribulose-phosphate 3-epimerase [Balneolales bacterium]
MHLQPIIAPSILAADFTKLGDQIKICADNGITWIHCDIMDGHFVPNISYGPMIVEAARKAYPAGFMDVHLMIYNPDQYTDAFVKAGADLISVHVEATPHLHRSVQNIKNKGIQAGVAVNPATPVQQVVPILSDIDLVVLMSVNPGFGGQKFIDTTYERIHELVEIRQKRKLNFRIEIDGGVGPDNISALYKAGADTFVAGSSIFGANNIPLRIQELKSLLHSGTT